MTPLDSLWLTLGAKVATAVADDYPLNRGATDGAKLTTEAVGDLKLEVGSAQCTIGTKVGIHAGKKTIHNILYIAEDTFFLRYYTSSNR